MIVSTIVSSEVDAGGGGRLSVCIFCPRLGRVVTLVQAEIPENVVVNGESLAVDVRALN